MKSLNKPESYKIALYLRVSTEEQAENPEGSIKNQELRLREFVKLKNMDQNFGEISGVFCDPGISAKDMNRPQLQKLLSEIKKGQINLVLVTELSRLTRSTKDFSILWEFMADHNCKFLSLRDNFDSTTPAGEMIMFTLANFAQFERKQTAKRISNAFLSRAKRGLWNGGSLPLGYHSDPQRPGYLVIDDEEAAIVRKVFDMFLVEETLSRTGRALNNQKITMPRKLKNGGGYRQGHFTTENVYGILTNKSYIGLREFKSKDGKQTVNAVWQPIIDETKFNRVQRILKKNKYYKKSPKENRYPYLLSGILFCKKCGDRLCGKSAHGNGGKIAYYEHTWSTKSQACLSKKIFSCEPHRILAKKIEPVIWDNVKKLFFDEKFLKDIFNEAQAFIKPKTLDLQPQLKRKISGVDYQITALAERVGLLPKDLDPKPLYDQLSKLQKVRFDLETELKNAEATINEADLPINMSDFSEFTKSLKQKIESEERPEVMSSIIKKLIHKIEVTDVGVIVHYHVGQKHFEHELNDDKGIGVEVSTRKTTKALSKYKNLNFSDDAGSNSLKIGAVSVF